MLTKEQIIQECEGLFPPDSNFPDTAEIGKRFLEQAKSEIEGWRTEPKEVLFRFLQLCKDEDSRQTRKHLKKDRW